MHNEHNTELQERLEVYIERTGISQQKLAPIIGISAGGLSQYRNSIYKGNIESIEKKIAEFLTTAEQQHEQDYRKEIYGGIMNEYIPTSVSEDVYKMIKYCQLEGGMVIVHGDAGIGKTKGAQKFISENPSQTIYIQATPATGTMANMIKMLARALRLPDTKNKLDLLIMIREKLENTNKVIVIDEAQHLKISALEEIRTLSDPSPLTGAKGIGIVLIGNTEVYSRMLGKQEARFAQLFSRVKMNKYYSTADVQQYDIDCLFPLLKDKQQKNFLLGISRSKWGIRGAVNVYNNAVNNENITMDGLYSMARSMGIGVLG